MKQLKEMNVIMCLGCLLALFSAMPAQAVTYQNQYLGSYSGSASYGNGISVSSAPSYTMQSTSGVVLSTGTVTGTLNDDGTVNEAAYVSSAPSRPRRADANGDGIEDDDTDNPVIEDGDIGNPIGDAVIPLLLLSFIYAVYRVSLRRKQV